MKKLIFSMFILVGLNSISFASAVHDKTILECNKVASEVKKTPLKSVNQLLMRASDELVRNYDEKLLVALVGLFKSSYSVDSNYFSVEFVHPVIAKHKDAFYKEAKKQFSKADFKTFEENVGIYEKEEKEGNDPK